MLGRRPTTKITTKRATQYVFGEKKRVSIIEEVQSKMVHTHKTMQPSTGNRITAQAQPLLASSLGAARALQAMPLARTPLAEATPEVVPELHHLLWPNVRWCPGVSVCVCVCTWEVLDLNCFIPQVRGRDGRPLGFARELFITGQD